jgi:hypothetical protein
VSAATADAIANLAALALRLADAHRHEQDAQARYGEATKEVCARAIYVTSDQYREASDAQEAAFRDCKAALQAKRDTLAELMAVADEWNADAAQPVDDKRGESLDPPRPQLS